MWFTKQTPLNFIIIIDNGRVQLTRDIFGGVNKAHPEGSISVQLPMQHFITASCKSIYEDHELNVVENFENVINFALCNQTSIYFPFNSFSLYFVNIFADYGLSNICNMANFEATLQPAHTCQWKDQWMSPTSIGSLYTSFVPATSVGCNGRSLQPFIGFASSLLPFCSQQETFGPQLFMAVNGLHPFVAAHHQYVWVAYQFFQVSLCGC